MYSCKTVPSKVCAPRVLTKTTFSHSWHLKQDDLGKMMQFLSIRGRRLHLLLSRMLERKANPSLPTLMPELETKQKKRRWSPNHNNWKHGNTSVQELLTSLKSRAEDQTHQCQTQRKITRNKFLNTHNWKIAKAKLIVPKPKAKQLIKLLT